MALSAAEDLRLWRIDRTLDELVAWVYGNRYIRELTCEERQLYRVEPLCGTEERLPVTPP